MNKDIKICFMGTPEFALNVLEMLNDEYTVTLVVTQPDRRGKRKIEESPVKKYAISRNLSLIQPEHIKEAFDEISKYEFDFLVTAAYGQIIPLSIIHLAKIRALNVHGSLLPKGRGGAPIQRAIMDGEEYTGVSIMRVVQKMDAGCVYAKRKIKIEDSDTTDSLMEKLSEIGSRELKEVIDMMYSKEEIHPLIQNEDEVTFTPVIKKEEELIDFSWSARKVFDRIRALYSDPLAKFVHDGITYTIYSSEVVEYKGSEKPGTIIDSSKKLIIKCGDMAISILEIQSPGKKRMNISDFLNGSRRLFEKGTLI